MEWRKISRNTNYSISEEGQVRNDITGRIKAQYINKDNGYPTVDLYKDNKSMKVTVHRLLAEAFIPNPENKPCIDHKDGNRQNNSLNNLRWATYSENNSRFNTIGVRSEKIKVTHYIEKKNPRNGCHLSWEDVDQITFFNRITDAAEHFDCNLSNISVMLKRGEIGRRGKLRGYRFEYCNKNGSVTTIENTQKCGSE